MHSLDVKFVTPAMADLGIRVLNTTNADGGWQFCVHTNERANLTEFRAYCQREGVKLDIRKLRSTSAPQARGMGLSGVDLTARQYEVAATATWMGYFDEEGANAGEVAAALDITPSTLFSHLHTVIAKVFICLFD